MNSIREKVVNEFLAQVRIDSLSLKEEAMFAYLRQRLQNLPVEITSQKYKVPVIGASSENLVVKIPANTSEKHPSLFFDSHVDTVEPGLGILPVVDGDIIRSEGNTILGSDDKSGSAAMVIALEELCRGDIPHGDLYFAFTSAEEIGLLGVNHFDFSLIPADYGFILDSHGSVGGVIIAAPYHFQYEIKVQGKASHAGIAPEKGVNAIKIAAKIITELPQGRISSNTVANIGLIEGGKATNIVADECIIRGEYRSLDFNDVKTLHEKIHSIVANYKEEATGVELIQTEAYKGFQFNDNAPIIRFVDRALWEMKIEPRHEKTGGGSNTNIYNMHDITSVTLATGMMNVHSKEEYIAIEDLERLTQLILTLARITD